MKRSCLLLIQFGAILESGQSRKINQSNLSTYEGPLQFDSRHAVFNGNITKCASNLALMILFQQVIRVIVRNIISPT